MGQAPPPDPLSAAIAQLTKGAFPGKEAADKVIALIVDYYTNNAIAIKPDGTATGTTTIVPDSTDQTKNVPVTLTVTTVASQTPIGAKIGLKNNLSVSTFAVLDVDKFMSNTFNYFATPMVAIGDSNQILCGIKGPVFPTAGNFTASTGNLTKGPTPFMAVRPLAPAQPGYVYGAGNYTTVPAVGAARAYWYDNKTAVTTAIKATDGTPLFFDNQLSRVRMHVALSGPNDPKGNGLKITATKLGDVTTYYGDYDQLNPTFNADLISATQTIPWK